VPISASQTRERRTSEALDRIDGEENMLLAMNRRLRRTQGSLAIAFALALAIGPELAEAQNAQGTPPAAPAAPATAVPPAAPQQPPAPPAAEAPSAAPAAQAEAPAADRFSEEELRKLLAPIALYPDALLAQLLPAAAYPLEIVQAQRWLDANPARTTFPESTARNGIRRSRQWRAFPTSFAR
jgi:hypothetical protein